MTGLPATPVERIFRDAYGRAVAVLTRVFGSIELAEEAVQDAFATAIERWPVEGVPPSPVGWIITTARHRAIDRLRRESSREERHAAAALLYEQDEPEEHAVADDQLRLIFTCCHPALSADARVALTLRLIGGLTTAEIAHAFLVPEATLAQRLVRAKTKIRDAGIAYRIPDAVDLPERLHSVRAVIYLIFNEGYLASSGKQVVREELCQEAVRLGRLLCALLPQDCESLGLLALMLLIDARRAARATPEGDLILLAQQNRALWNPERIEEGRALMQECLRRNHPGPYQIQAAINAVHSDARTTGEIDWRQILQLYDQLLPFDSGPVVMLNRAVAVAEVHGAEAGLRTLDQLNLAGYYLFHAIRADLLRRLGRTAEAGAAYEAAIERCGNERERKYLRQRRQALA